MSEQNNQTEVKVKKVRKPRGKRKSVSHVDAVKKAVARALVADRLARMAVEKAVGGVKRAIGRVEKVGEAAEAAWEAVGVASVGGVEGVRVLKENALEALRRAVEVLEGGAAAQGVASGGAAFEETRPESKAAEAVDAPQGESSEAAPAHAEAVEAAAV